jgi:hypothetical protein
MTKRNGTMMPIPADLMICESYQDEIRSRELPSLMFPKTNSAIRGALLRRLLNSRLSSTEERSRRIALRYF